jgi:hypothetical protein
MSVDGVVLEPTGVTTTPLLIIDFNGDQKLKIERSTRALREEESVAGFRGEPG